MLKPLTLLTLVTLTLATTGCASLRVDKAAQVATGFAAHLLCNDVLVSGVDAATAFDERVRPLRGMASVAWALSPRVDLQQRQVTVTLAGAFESRSRWREGQGCVTFPADEMDRSATDSLALPPPPPDPYAGQQPQPGPALQAVLDSAIPGLGQPAPHGTKALLVLQHGRLVAERYAAGVGPDTPVLGFSATKSVTAALLGVLAHQGRLAIDQPAPIAEWQHGGDPRRAITVAQLLRQTSGLALPQTNSGFDITSQIMYTAADKAAAAAAVPLAHAPGTSWAYSDGHFMLLARVLRQATGGSTDALLRLAHDELFGPLGMRHVTLDVDAAGTPLLSSHLMASARDWSRLGQLWLDDGVIDGHRILPAGWVAMTSTPTLDTGYGAGWWTNRRAGLVPDWRSPWGLPGAPADTVFARGFMGNAVVVVPSRGAVVVRLSVAPAFGDDIGETDRIVAAVLAALP